MPTSRAIARGRYAAERRTRRRCRAPWRGARGARPGARGESSTLVTLPAHARHTRRAMLRQGRLAPPMGGNGAASRGRADPSLGRAPEQPTLERLLAPLELLLERRERAVL